MKAVHPGGGGEEKGRLLWHEEGGEGRFIQSERSERGEDSERDRATPAEGEEQEEEGRWIAEVY